MATRYSQPQSGARLNLANPLVKKLRYLSPLGGNTLDLVSGKVGVVNGGAPSVPTAKGLARSFSSASSRSVTLPTTNLVSGYPLTVACWVSATPTASGGVFYSLNGTGYSAILGFLSTYPAVMPNVGSDPSFNQGKLISSPLPLSYLVAVHRSGSFDLYVDGVLATSTAILNSAWAEPAVGNHSIGSRLGGASLRYHDGPISDLAVFQGELSAAEIKALTANPNQLYAPSSRSIWIPSAPVDPSGDLTAVETGSDVFAWSGVIPVVGGVSVSETGPDVAAISGSSASEVSGSLSVSESGADAFAWSGVTPVSGTFATTESGSDVFGASGVTPVVGTLSVSESGADSLSSSGNTFVQGSLTITEAGADTFGFSGVVLEQGSMAALESGSDVAAFTGTAIVGASGSLIVTESGSDIFGASGVAPVVGSCTASEVGADVFAWAGVTPISGGMSATESGTDTATILGDGPALISGVFSASEFGLDTFAWAGAAPVVGSFSAYESGTLDAPVFAGEALVQAWMSAVESGFDTCNIIQYKTVLYLGTRIANCDASRKIADAGALNRNADFVILDHG